VAVNKAIVIGNLGGYGFFNADLANQTRTDRRRSLFWAAF
jgi:hypothetical protein